MCPCYSTASTTGTTYGWAYMPARDTRAKQRAQNKKAQLVVEEGFDEKAYNVNGVVEERVRKGNTE